MSFQTWPAHEEYFRYCCQSQGSIEDERIRLQGYVEVQYRKGILPPRRYTVLVIEEKSMEQGE